jgi:type III secretion system YscQ/HrcQ family protein
MRKAETPRLPLMVREQLMWKLSVRLGFAVLNLRDLENLEPGDMLLYTQQAQIVLPGTAPERGWDAEWRREEPSRLTVTRCFERSALMEENTNESQKTETTTEIELDSLPVQVSVLLQELEFSLHDLEGLKEGSIVEIGEIPEQVQLVVNGKVFGAGELVRIDDRLGVQITRWRKS